MLSTDTVLGDRNSPWQYLHWLCQTQRRVGKTTAFSLSHYLYWIHSFRIPFPISITIKGISCCTFLCFCALHLERLESFCQVWLDRCLPVSSMSCFCYCNIVFIEALLVLTLLPLYKDHRQLQIIGAYIYCTLIIITLCKLDKLCSIIKI